MRDMDVVPAGLRSASMNRGRARGRAPRLPARRARAGRRERELEITVAPALPANVSVGDTNVRERRDDHERQHRRRHHEHDLRAGRAAPCPGDSPGITLMPSCSALDFARTPAARGPTPASSPSNRPRAAAGTACSDEDVRRDGVVDATFGKVRFVPSGGNVVLPTPGSSCRIDFTFDVLAAARRRQRRPAIRRCRSPRPRRTRTLNAVAFSRNTQPVNVTPRRAGADRHRPRLARQRQLARDQGHRAGRHDLRSACTRTPPARARRSRRARRGLRVAGPHRAGPRRHDDDVLRGGRRQPRRRLRLLASTITYVEDSTPPAVPSVSDTDPDSPANNNNPASRARPRPARRSSSTRTRPARAPSPAQGTRPPSPPRPARSPSPTTRRRRTTRPRPTPRATSRAARRRAHIRRGLHRPRRADADGHEPASPVNDNTPQIIGTAEAGTTVTHLHDPDLHRDPGRRGQRRGVRARPASR